MSIVSTTMCYPSAAAPTQGVFVECRLKAIALTKALRVVAPIPWFPFIRPLTFSAAPDLKAMPPVWHPRMFYFPGIAKDHDAMFYQWAFARTLKSLQADEPVHVIDAHFEWPDGVGAFHAAQNAGLPFVCTLRGKLVSQIKSPRRREQIVEMLRGASALIAVSQSLADLAAEVAGRRLNIRVIPNGIDTAAFHRIEQGQSESEPAPAARKSLGWPADAKVAVSVGHLQELKGFHRLVSVWPAVRRQIGDARLVLVGGSAGEPDYEWRLNRQIVSLKMADYIDVAGRIPPEKVATMLNAADLFLLASRSEGCCNAIAESLACGCPVVATDVGGNREIISDPALGRLVDTHAGAELEALIVEALQTTWDRTQIAAKGGERTWQQVAAECVDVLESVQRKR